MASTCHHLKEIWDVTPSADGCEDCLKIGDDWVHLRLCLTCGHVGCCDSSKNKHATKHFHAQHHPIMKSFEPGEDWRWCYVDKNGSLIFMATKPTKSQLPTIEAWPPLPIAEWSATRDTLHMWTQIVGKVRLALSPLTNHWWEVPLYVSARGLTTSPIPYPRGIFEVEFDFIDHVLTITTSRGEMKMMTLVPRSVARFYEEFMNVLASLGIEPKSGPCPSKFQIRYASTAISRTTLTIRNMPIVSGESSQLIDTIFKEFRARFIGKASPVHFFWGSFDLAVTRFSGRRAPERPGVDAITREAYSHEVISAGWWAGGGEFAAPMFYAYAAPEPPGFAPARRIQRRLSITLSWENLCCPTTMCAPQTIPRPHWLEFLQSTYEAGATSGKWDRAALERNP